MYSYLKRVAFSVSDIVKCVFFIVSVHSVKH